MSPAANNAFRGSPLNEARDAYEKATAENLPGDVNWLDEMIESGKRSDAELAADRQLVKDMEALTEDPRNDPGEKWDRKVGWKNEAQYEYAERYRKFAKLFFEVKLDNMTLDSDDLRGDPGEGR